MENPVQIKSVQHLYDILNHSECVREFFIQLNGCRSWKNIYLDCNKDKFGRWKFHITNEIDDTVQVLTYNNLDSPRYSNIWSAINCGAFYLYDGNENSDKSDVKYYERDDDKKYSVMD